MNYLRAAADRTDLVAVFADIWAELIPNSPFDERLTWAESGVDSLKGLIFWLRLEQVLERPLSYDIMTREMTPAEEICWRLVPTPLPHFVTAKPSWRCLSALLGDATWNSWTPTV